MVDCRLKRQRTVPEKDAKAIFMQIMSGLRYLNRPHSYLAQGAVVFVICCVVHCVTRYICWLLHVYVIGCCSTERRVYSLYYRCLLCRCEIVMAFLNTWASSYFVPS